MNEIKISKTLALRLRAALKNGADGLTCASVLSQSGWAWYKHKAELLLELAKVIDKKIKNPTDEKAEVMKVLRDNNMSMSGFENCNNVADIVREMKCDNLQLWADLKLERQKREELEIKMQIK